MTLCPGRANTRSTRPAASADRKSTRLNSSHDQISYAVFCLKKKKNAGVATHDEDRDRSAQIDHRRRYQPTRREAINALDSDDGADLVDMHETSHSVR